MPGPRAETIYLADAIAVHFLVQFVLLFCRLCWQENVHVIVMLTREVEGATVKSGNYWSGEKFGPLRLKLVSEEGALAKQRECSFLWCGL